MSLEFYLITGIILGLLFTELTGLSPGGIIVPGYLAYSLYSPIDIIFTVSISIAIYYIIKLLSKAFYLFGRRRYALAILLGIFFKLSIEYFFNFLDNEAIYNLAIIGYLVPGLIANDLYKQGIIKTLLSSVIVTSLVYIIALGVSFAIYQ